MAADLWRLLSVYNVLGPTNVPIEPFLRTPEPAELYVVSFHQSQGEAIRALETSHPGHRARVHGLDGRRRPLRASFALAALLRQVRPDLVHTHHSISAAAVSALRRLTATRVVMTLHGKRDSYSRRQRALLALGMVGADALVFNSSSTKASWLRSTLTQIRGKPHYISYNGVDLAAVKAAAQTTRASSCPTRPTIACIASLVPAKDHVTLLRGFARFRASGGEADLVIVGGGPLREALEREAARLGASARIRFVGQLSRPEVYDLLHQVDIVAFTSKWEGFCNALVEAMAARRAVVASRIDTFEEVLGQECAAFFPCGDADALAQRLSELCADSERRALLGARAAERAEERYSLSGCVERYTRIYSELIDGCPGDASARGEVERG